MVSKLFAQFIKEKKYLGNLSQRTLDSYEKDVYKRWIRFIGDVMPNYENVKTFVIEMTEAGLSPTTINLTVRSWNVFLTWLWENEHIPKPIKIQQVKAVKRTMRAVPEQDMAKLLKTRHRGMLFSPWH
jgi:site-specific recombinase XerD